MANTLNLKINGGSNIEWPNFQLKKFLIPEFSKIPDSRIFQLKKFLKFLINKIPKISNFEN